MTGSSDVPRRLLFGPAEFRGYEGVVIDAETGTRWAAGAAAQTWGEFARTMYAEDWNEFVARNELENEEVNASDPFSFEEWVSETWEPGAEEVAHDVAMRRIRVLIEERPTELGDIRLGGGSPGGNIDVFSGPLDQLQLLAGLIDPVRDRFTLERDDAAVEAGMLRSIWL